MPTFLPTQKRSRSVLFLQVFVLLICFQTSFSQICTNPANVIYGLTSTGSIHAITVSTGAVSARLNPTNTGLAPSLSNAMGYNPLNGKFYYFKRHAYPGPQEFLVWDPAMGSVTQLANCPSVSVSNLGCVTQDGSGYYCIDAYGILYYYNIPLNAWRTIGSNIRDQYGVLLSSVISANNRIAGDIAIDGNGNMWIVVAGNTDFGLYKLSAPLPVVATATVNITRLQDPTTPTPTGNSFGGIAFNSTGQIFLSTNTDNKLYRLENNLTLTFLSNMTLNGIGNDLTSCNFPLMILSASFRSFNASLVSGDNVSLQWTVQEGANTSGYAVEYSVDGLSWNEVTFLAVQNGTNSETEYHYLHNTSFSSIQYYRIARVSVDGGRSYSSVQTVNKHTTIKLKVWPNPTVALLTVELEGMRNDGPVMLKVVDQMGKEVSRAVLSIGINEFNVTHLNSGLYVVTVLTADSKTYHQKFLKR